MTSHLAQLEQIGKLRSKEIKPGTELRITVAQEKPHLFAYRQ